MKKLRSYLPALTVSICACSGGPSTSTAPSAMDAGSTDPSTPTPSATGGEGDDVTQVTEPESTGPAPTTRPPLDRPETSRDGTETSSGASEVSPNGEETDAGASFDLDGGQRPASTVSEEADPKPPLSAPIGTRNFACDPSPSPMFQSQEVLQMRITADFSVVNGNEKESAVSAGLLDPDGDAGPLAAIPVEVHARGISRFSNCGYRPFKVKFSEKQKDNVFHKLGKSVKFTTHCGDREGMHETLKAPSLEEYYERVRMEHLSYQLLAPLDTMSLATRLVWVTYEDTSTGLSETHLAFVREPEDELGQRCGMVEGEDIPEDVPSTLNQRANLLLYLVNNFLIQSDVKNQFDLVDVERQLSSPVPYDFDLLGIFRRDYLGLRGRTLTQNAEAFADWLRRNQSGPLHEEVRLILSKSREMQELIADAHLSDTNRALFDEWLDVFTKVLETFDRCEPSEDDPAAVACYVPDDHSDSVEGAQVLPPGEHSLMLEPPNDRDVVSVELAPDRLYSLIAPLHATLRSPRAEVVGELLGTGGSAPMMLSLRPETAGAYSVEFDWRDALVWSSVWNNSPEALLQPFAFYEDDHGSSLPFATRLVPGETTDGWFELEPERGLLDEDWFTVEITADTHVYLASETNYSAFLEVHSSAEPTTPLSSHTFDAQGAREELTALFPGPGEYVVKVFQGWARARYSLEVANDSD